jgi:prepilin-type N-terminal cleavage/methylation domain-containing protein
MKREGTPVHPIGKRAHQLTERGMTLVELCVAMCIFAIAVAGLYQISTFAYRFWTNGIQEEQIEHQMDLVMGFMDRDIKQAQYNAATKSYYSIYNVNGGQGNEVEIYEDVYNNGVLDAVFYWLDVNTNTLKRSVVAPVNGAYPAPTQWQTLLTGVCSAPPLFSTQGTISNGHPNLSIGVELTVQNPVVPTSPLVLSTTYSIRGNTGLQEENPNAV